MSYLMAFEPAPGYYPDIADFIAGQWAILEAQGKRYGTKVPSAASCQTRRKFRQIIS